MPKQNVKMHDEESLRAILKELERTTESARVMVNAIIDDGALPINVKNNTILVRGLGYIAKFVAALREAHLDARMEAGDLDAEPRKVTKGARRKRGR